jgi:hypothetical protein
MKCLIVFAFLLISFPDYGQDFDRLMVKKSIDCSDVSINSSQLFIKYVTENKNDSAKALIQYWQGKCGLREPIYRSRILLALKERNFNDSLVTEKVLWYFFNYLNRKDLIKNKNYYSYDDNRSYYGFIPPGEDFDNFTLKMASDLKSTYQPGSYESLFCDFYSGSGDTIFSKLQTDKYVSTVLGEQYNKTVEENLETSELHASLIAGTWIPTGGIKKLGVHPELGFQIGSKKNKMSYDLTMVLRFLNTPEYYYARREGLHSTPELTNYFFGGYVGFDCGRDLYSRNGNEISFLAGAGYDGFDTFRSKTDSEDEKTGSVGSFNLNFGVGYRYYYSNTSYFGFRLKYNMVNYANSDVIDFNGNPVTVQFVFGGLLNIVKKQNLKMLKYKWRK